MADPRSSIWDPATSFMDVAGMAADAQAEARGSHYRQDCAYSEGPGAYFAQLGVEPGKVFKE